MMAKEAGARQKNPQPPRQGRAVGLVRQGI